MATKKLTTISRYTGLSTDTKPTGVPVGSTYYEYDTRDMRITYDGTNWVLKIGKVALVEETGYSKFGEPTVQAINNADAVWSRAHNSFHAGSGSGWYANLYGGPQTGDDWASYIIPVKDMKVTDLDDMGWKWYQTNAEVYGLNIVIWVHDKNDHDIRAEITQSGSATSLDKGAGWNSHEFPSTAAEYFWYGENISGSGLSTGTLYTWAQFQADVTFSGLEIYKISLESGWYTTGIFEEYWLSDVQINGQVIPIKPDSGGSGRIGHRNFTTASGDLTGTIAPKTPFRLLSLDVHVTAVPDTGEVLTLTKDAGQGVLYDTLLLTDDLFIGSRTSEFYILGEGYDFSAEDEVDLFQTNGSDDDWGVTITYQTVFS